jgi:catechol 2,3-dioxygenase-like lactoylglutathione lyase family enzyme
MSSTLITHLRHVDLAVPDYLKQVAFYRDHWGLAPVGTDSGLTYFAAEGSPEQYIIRVRDSAEKRLDLVSFGAENPSAVNTLAEQLGQAGVTLIFEPRDLQTPGGGYGFRFFDLEGRTIEVSADVEARVHRKIEEKEDIPVRLSHVVLNSPEPEKMLAWYEKHLGFRLSDTLNHPRVGDIFYFLRCSPQHHSMAIARGPHPSLQHVSFELRGIDEYMRGSGRLIRAGWEKVWGPGRHRAGENTFTYFIDPSGNTMEYTTELETLDEDVWHPHIYDVHEPETSDVWGTSNPMNDFVAQKMFNEPDKGVFVAPPV